MNISNTISYDASYAKSDSADMSIKQSVPTVKSSASFKESVDVVERKENLDDMTKIIDKSNKELMTYDRKLEISIHSKTKEVMVKVIDTITDEVIRELPPEKVLDTVAYRKEISGILMDKKI